MPRPHDHVIFTDLNGVEGVLVDLNTRQYFQLNETASLIWRGLAKGTPVADIAERVDGVVRRDPGPRAGQRRGLRRQVQRASPPGFDAVLTQDTPFGAGLARRQAAIAGRCRSGSPGMWNRPLEGVGAMLSLTSSPPILRLVQ